MLGRQHHVGRSEESVGPGGEHAQSRRPFRQAKIDLCPLALADPVALLFLDRLGPIDLVQVGQQPVGVSGDAQQPLAQRDAHDRMVASFRLAVDHFLVGQHGAQGRAPVDRHLGLVGQPFAVSIGTHGRRALLRHLGRDGQFGDGPALFAFGIVPGVEQDQEDPLRPAEIVRIGGIDLAVPVVAEAQLPGSAGGSCRCSSRW